MDPGAFTVTTGSGGDVVYNMSAPEFVRDGTMGTVTVTYENVGTSDALASLLALIGTNAVLRLPDETSFFGSTVQFLAIDSSGPAGILPPASLATLRSISRPAPPPRWGCSITFELGLEASDQPIDWASVKDEFQPAYISSDAWNPIWANFLASVDTTAGDLQVAVDRDVTVPSQLGEYNYDGE